MTPCNKEVARTTGTPVLNAALLARVQELNRNYLELLATQADMSAGVRMCGSDSERLPPAVVEALARLPALSRARVAASPYALYTLGFEDQPLWRTALCECAVADRDDAPLDYYDALSVSPGIAFCEVALFFAWHTAVLNRFAARVLFAMPEALAETMVQTPLWRLRRIARSYPGLLAPRWPANPAFWPDLVRFAALSDWRRLETAQLLGHQLTAMELDPAFNEGRLPRGRAGHAEMPHARGSTVK